MKKIVISIFGLALVLVSAAICKIHADNNGEVFSELELANIEALAVDESLAPGRWEVNWKDGTHHTCVPIGETCCPGYDC